MNSSPTLHAFLRLTVLLAATVCWMPCSLHAADKALEVVEEAGRLVIRDGDVEVLVYHTAEVPPPEGADPVFRRSGFLHPVRTPGGRIVTGIHPADHFHHLGLWHAWVKCRYDGEEIDFWNLKKGKGRVRFAAVDSLITEGDGAGFVVIQEHVAYLGDEKREVVILSEKFRVQVQLVEGAYEIDYETHQTHVGEHPLELPAYRYGGPIAYRSPLHWTKDNSDYLSSEGKTRIDGHETRSRWCGFHGIASEDEERVSLTILGHPENHDAPQRMRVWPPKTHKGTIFFNYVPIQEHAWAIEPGATSVMRYRLVVRDGDVDVADTEARWRRFSGQEN